MSGLSRDVEALLDASDSDDSHGPLDLHLGSVCLEDILREDAESDDYAESPRARTPPSRSPYASGTPPDRALAAAAAGRFAAAPPQHAWRSSGAAAAAAAAASAAHSETSDALRAILQEADDDESAAAGSSNTANFNSDRGAGGRSAAAAAAAARYGALPRARPDPFPSSSSTADIDRILAAADAADAAQNGAGNGAGIGAGAYGYATASGSSGSAGSASRNGGAAGGSGSACGAGAVAERAAAAAAAAAAGGNEALGLKLGRVEDGGARLAAAEAREQRLLRGGNRDVISPLRVKRRMRGARGHGLGTARLDTLNQISQQLAKGMQQQGAGGAGVPTALAVHPKFIAVGTSRGLVLLFDHFQVVRRVLGDPAGPAITSLDMCAGGDYLIAGNAGGGLALWDFMRGTALKATYEAHSAPITFVHCYKHSEPAVITADAAGVVNKVAFRRVMWTAWVAETACLLDGAAGCMLSVDVLRGWAGATPAAVPSAGEQGAGGAARPPDDAIAPFEAMRLMAMSSATNTFVVSIDPQVKVIYKWGRPELDVPPADAPKAIPCLSWSPPQVNSKPLKGGAGGTPGAPMALLARGWGRTVQLLAVSLEPPTVEVSDTGQDPSQPPPTAAVRLELVSAVATLSSVVAAAWLSASALVYVTADMAAAVYDVRTGTVLETLNMGAPLFMTPLNAAAVATCAWLPAELRQRSAADAAAAPAAPAAAAAAAAARYSCSNCARASDGALYALGEGRLCTLRMQDWSQRVGSLVAAGEWLEALSVALDQYERQAAERSTAAGKQSTSAATRTKPPARAPVSEALRESLAALLSRYVRLAVDNAPSAAAAAAAAAPPPAAAAPRQGEGAQGRLAKSHFQMLAGVCAEYCVVTERADVLFGEVLARFKEAGYTQTFLETLEPYVLEERLHTLQSTALREVAEHTLHSGDSQMLERWALHLDAAALAESPGALALLRRRGLYTALLRACGAGAGDYLAALEALLQDAMALADREHAHRAVAETPCVGSEPDAPSAAAPPRDCPYPLDPQLDALGYKALLYLRHCFRGAAFPGGEALGAAVLPAVRAQLLYLLFQRAISAGGLRPSMADPPLSPPPPEAPPVWKASPYPYLRILLYIDTPLTLETLAIALDSPEAEFEDGGAAGGPTGVVGGGAGKGAFGEEGMLAAAAMDMRVTVCPSRRFILSALSAVLAPGLLSEETVPALQGLQFKDREGRPWPRASCGAFLELAARYLERSLVQMPPPLINAVLQHIAALPPPPRQQQQQQQQQQEGSAQGRLVALLQRVPPKAVDADALLPLVEKAGHCRAAVAVLRARAHAHGLTQALFVQTLRGYLQGAEDDAFRRQAFAFVRNEARHLAATGGDPKGAVLDALSDLLELDAALAARAVAEVGATPEEAVAALNGSAHLQFRYLDAVQGAQQGDGDSGDSDLSPVQLLQYLSLLVRFRPGDVRPHLAAREGLYPLDAALALCKAHGVTDATAYLLERSGDAAGALALTVDALEEQLRALRRALRASPPAAPPSSAGAHALAELEEGRRAVRSLAAAVDLCQRSGGAASSAAAGDNQAAQAMWFAALDRVAGVKTAAAAGGGDGAAAMAAAADILLQRLLEGMTGYVPLPAIVGKVLSDHAQAPLGEFKGLIQSMLVVCSRETDVYRAAAVLLFGCAQRARAARRRLARAGVRVCAIDGRGLDPDTLARVAASRAIVRVRASDGQATTEAVTSAGQHEQTAETAAAAVHVWRLRAWRARAPPLPQLPFAHTPPPPPPPPPPRPENSGAEQGGRASPPAAAGGEGGVGRGWRVRGLLAAAMPQSLSDALGGGSSSGGGSAQQPAADG